ncbi:head GIN domain-containing protein [Confluentibacter sediminis]|uniref:head GIN domain-containing protein n=1 Tax=Confluentibacter sediminis TaxID=2219045 RepID=UPI000DAB7FB5|nr:head GIN domain-containing protein [Confluentibacter sediminis]
MKHLLTILVFSFTTLVFSQNSIEKNVGDFKELKVYDLIEVELIKSDSNKVIITGDNANSVLINNKNGTLKIKMEFSRIFDGENTKVKLYYTTLDVIDANEGVRIYSKDDIKQFEIDLKAQEGGAINVSVDVNYVNVKAVTGGIVEVIGTAKKENISLLTGGVFKGEKLLSENSDVSINAAGEAAINASKVVNIKIRAGGDVFIYGKPETVNESKVFGGRVKRMD